MRLLKLGGYFDGFVKVTLIDVGKVYDVPLFKRIADVSVTTIVTNDIRVTNTTTQSVKMRTWSPNITYKTHGKDPNAVYDVGTNLYLPIASGDYYMTVNEISRSDTTNGQVITYKATFTTNKMHVVNGMVYYTLVDAGSIEFTDVIINETETKSVTSTATSEVSSVSVNQHKFAGNGGSMVRFNNNSYSINNTQVTNITEEVIINDANQKYHESSFLQSAYERDFMMGSMIVASNAKQQYINSAVAAANSAVSSAKAQQSAMLDVIYNSSVTAAGITECMMSNSMTIVDQIQSNTIKMVKDTYAMLEKERRADHLNARLSGSDTNVVSETQILSNPLESPTNGNAKREGGAFDYAAWFAEQFGAANAKRRSY